MTRRPRKRQNIDGILRDWPYDPGELAARIVQGENGRPILQMRVDLGVLQMEPARRPDGMRFDGAESYYDHLVELAFRAGDDFQLDDEQCAEVDREFVQYYHRRTAWLALMDLSRRHSPDEQWTLSHEQYRPFVLFQRTQAAALAELEDIGAEAAIGAIEKGLVSFRRLFVNYNLEEHFEEDELVERLMELKESVREYYAVGRTLREQLTDAITAEEYERAARLRDEIERRRSGEMGSI